MLPYQILESQKNMENSYKNNEFKISAPTWDDEFELTDRQHSVSKFQYYFEHIIKT